MERMADKIRDWMERHTAEAVSFLQRLIEAPSTAGNEADVQRIVADKLQALGLEVDIWVPDGEELGRSEYFCSPRSQFAGSPNVVGVWKGRGGGRSIILNGHVDVVPAGDERQWTDSPWSGRVDGNRVYGRGSTDMKGGSTSLLYALQCLQALGVGLRGDVIFQSVVEEESGGAGTLAAIVRGYKADAALIPEPTGMQIFPKQQGSMWFRIAVRGRSAHGGTRYEGVSAIDKSMHVVDVLRELEKERNERIDDPLYAGVPIPVPINIGVIRGGDWPSSVPDLVVIEGRMGVAPGESMAQARAEFAAWVAQRCGAADEWLAEHPPEIEWFGARWVPGEIDPGHALVDALQRHVRGVTGSDAVVKASPWGTDGGLLAAAGGVPSVIFGPGETSVAHYPNEYIEIDRMMQAAAVIALALIDWCGAAK